MWHAAIAQPATYTIGGIFEFTLTNQETEEVFIADVKTLSQYTGYRLAIEDINASPSIFPNTLVLPEAYDTQGTVAVSSKQNNHKNFFY